jgi:hypothetical protein
VAVTFSVSTNSARLADGVVDAAFELRRVCGVRFFETSHGHHWRGLDELTIGDRAIRSPSVRRVSNRVPADGFPPRRLARRGLGLNRNGFPFARRDTSGDALRKGGREGRGLGELGFAS